MTLRRAVALWAFQGERLHSSITKRWFFVTLIGVAHLVCLLLAHGWFMRRLESTLHAQMQADALAETRSAAAQTAARLARGYDGDLLDASRVVEFVQRQIEPTGQVARIRAVDARTGLVIADSARRGTEPNRTRCESIGLLDGRKFPIERLSEAELTEARGLMRTSDGLQWVTARLVPELGIFVVAHRPLAGIARALTALIGSVDKAGVVILTIVSILGFLMVTAIVMAYQHRLGRTHDELERTVVERGRQLAATRDAIVYGLAKLAESRDDDTGEHLDRIRDYVRLLAGELAPSHPELDGAAIHRLCVTSSLHDIGKVGIPDAVLLKPGPLTAHERAVIEKHPTIGGDCLMALRERLGEDNNFLDVACEIAFAHHERWDGAGYPFGLAGEEIPLAARIVALADVYDALTTRRAYKPAMTHEQARAIIVDGEGTQFDPQVVGAFRRCEEQFRRRAGYVDAQGDATPNAPAPHLPTKSSKPQAVGASMPAAEDRA